MILRKLEDVGGLPRVRFDRPEGHFSPVYMPDPPGNFASLNAGDYALYVGGGAINAAFAQALRWANQTPDTRYSALHKTLLTAAWANPGELAWLHPGSVEPSCMDDIMAMVGIVPPDKEFETLNPVGLVSITIFPEGKRPCKSDRNVAMVYAVGPDARHTWRRQAQQEGMSLESFLSILEKVGANIASAVRQYNATIDEAEAKAKEWKIDEPNEQIIPQIRKVNPRDRYGAPMSYDECMTKYEGEYTQEQTHNFWHRHCRLHVDTGDRTFCRPPHGLVESLPRIEVLRVALLSGGRYMHHAAKKEDVAAALTTGLVARGSGPTMPVLDFAFDENAFGKAWTSLGLTPWSAS
mmetsp:Transcript_72712/g.151804  ORF Transcript_72712/g.151804 Transcript_72712/m.151804 type:complete len:351 (+) Transcript_72712:167-1219(+)